MKKPGPEMDNGEKKEILGIFVPTDKHIDHLIGIARAAKRAGKALCIFFTHNGGHGFDGRKVTRSQSSQCMYIEVVFAEITAGDYMA